MVIYLNKMNYIYLLFIHRYVKSIHANERISLYVSKNMYLVFYTKIMKIYKHDKHPAVQSIVYRLFYNYCRIVGFARVTRQPSKLFPHMQYFLLHADVLQAVSRQISFRKEKPFTSICIRNNFTMSLFRFAIFIYLKGDSPK